MATNINEPLGADSPGPLPADAAPPGCPHCGQSWEPSPPIKPGWSRHPHGPDSEED